MPVASRRGVLMNHYLKREGDERGTLMVRLFAVGVDLAAGRARRWRVRRGLMKRFASLRMGVSVMLLLVHVQPDDFILAASRMYVKK